MTKWLPAQNRFVHAVGFEQVAENYLHETSLFNS